MYTYTQSTKMRTSEFSFLLFLAEMTSLMFSLGFLQGHRLRGAGAQAVTLSYLPVFSWGQQQGQESVM